MWLILPRCTVIRSRTNSRHGRVYLRIFSKDPSCTPYMCCGSTTCRRMLEAGPSQLVWINSSRWGNVRRFTVDGKCGRALVVRLEVALHLLYFILCKRFLERDVPLKWMRDLSFSQRCLRCFKCSGVTPYRLVIDYRRLEGASFSRFKDSRNVCDFSWTVWPCTWRHCTFVYQSIRRNIP